MGAALREGAGGRVVSRLATLATLHALSTVGLAVVSLSGAPRRAWADAPCAEGAACPLTCRDDERLSVTAADLLLRSEAITAASLLPRAREHGFDGVSLHARQSLNDKAIASWLRGLVREPGGWLSCGEARNEAGRLVLAVQRWGSLEQQGTQLTGELADSYDQPRLVIEQEDRSYASLPLTRAQLRAGFRLPEPWRARRVQLLAEGPAGPRPLAELTLVNDDVREPAPIATSDARAPGKAINVLARVAALRREERLPSLRDNRLLSESAERHATRLAKSGALAHVVADEDPEARLLREHVAARTVGEVLASAENTDAAWEALLQSPSHRMTVTRRDFTDVGVGQASDAHGRVWLVVVFASWPRRTP